MPLSSMPPSTLLLCFLAVLSSRPNPPMRKPIFSIADTQDRGNDETEDKATPHHSPFCDPGAAWESRLARIPPG
ncbi:hypothetical protein B0H14DRAFT_2827774 [Mycena olivaceomarginata]|nr:hypothetical protein B0H14DRAFT_2827774 [Mycena olivaceomarginata]